MPSKDSVVFPSDLNRLGNTQTFSNVHEDFKKIPNHHTIFFKTTTQINIWSQSLLLINYPNHCVKSVRIRSCSGLYFHAFGLNAERCGVSLPIQSECGNIRTRITLNTDTFYAVNLTPPIILSQNEIFSSLK